MLAALLAPDLVDRAQGHHYVVLLLLVQLDALHLLALVQLLRSIVQG